MADMHSVNAGVEDARLVHVACPYCAGLDAAPWAQENGYSAVRCSGCDLVFVNPRRGDDEISEAAQTGQHETDSGRLSVVSRFRGSKVRHYRERLEQLYPDAELRRRPLSWLDVGAGYGELLMALGGLLAEGSVLDGIEPCEPKAREARRLGLSVSDTAIADVERRYDVVSMFNVFSHLPDPRRFLSDLSRVLVPGGEMVIVTGNGAEVSAADYPRPYYFPDHLIFAGERHIVGLLEELGYDVLQVERHADFLPEGRLKGAARNAFRSAVGQGAAPWMDLVRGKRGPFRFLFVRARLAAR